MVVDIRIGGVPYWSLPDITVEEDASPLDPSDSFGGVGTISFTVPEGAGAKSLLNSTVDVDDSVRGVTKGVVKALAGDGSNVTVDAFSRLSALVGDRTALPHVGTLESCLLYYFSLCGVTTGIVIDPSIATIPVTAIGWYGNVWEYVQKKFCPAYQVELTLLDGDIHVRPPRSVTVARERESRFSWALDESQLAETVEAWYYPVEQITNALVVGNEMGVLPNLDAGEVHEFDVELTASLSSVVQPVAVDSVEFSDASASEYSVLDQYGEPVPAAAWAAGGGSVRVEISDDTRRLHVTVAASQNRMLAPYELAGFTISGDKYSTLRVVGTGVAFEREKYVLPACTDGRATDEVGAEVDNEFLSSWGHAHLVLIGAAGRHGSAVQRVTGVSRFYEAYGNVAGARLFDDFNVYRIRTATSPPTDVPFQAESDVILADVNAVNAGHLISDWNDLWVGRPISEFNLRPLTPLPGVVTESTYPSVTTFPSTSTFPG